MAYPSQSIPPFFKYNLLSAGPLRCCRPRKLEPDYNLGIIKANLTRLNNQLPHSLFLSHQLTRKSSWSKEI
jgi:hypothetical protein